MVEAEEVETFGFHSVSASSPFLVCGKLRRHCLDFLDSATNPGIDLTGAVEDDLVAIFDLRDTGNLGVVEAEDCDCCPLSRYCCLNLVLDHMTLRMAR